MCATRILQVDRNTPDGERILLESEHTPPRGDSGWPGTCFMVALLLALIAEARPVTERLRVCEIGDQRQRLVRIIRRGSGSVVT
jgi:hypothetical protein